MEDPDQLKKAHSRCFPRLLHYVLDRVEMEGISDHTIGWAPSGLEFIIYDHDRFMEEVVPQYFHKQSKFRSFCRQLNLWGFRRVSREMHGVRSIWRHEFFQRGQHEMIPRMKRCDNKKAAAKEKYAQTRKTEEKNEAVDSDGETSKTAKNTNQLHSDDRKVAAVATSFEPNTQHFFRMPPDAEASVYPATLPHRYVPTFAAAQGNARNCPPDLRPPQCVRNSSGASIDVLTAAVEIASGDGFNVQDAGRRLMAHVSEHRRPQYIRKSSGNSIDVLAMAAEKVAFTNDTSLQRENGYVMKRTEYEMICAKVSNNQLINKAGRKREEKRDCQGLKRFQDLLDMKNLGSITSEGARVLEQGFLNGEYDDELRQIKPNTMTSGELSLANKINATQNIVGAKNVRLSFVQKRGRLSKPAGSSTEGEALPAAQRENKITFDPIQSANLKLGKNDQNLLDDDFTDNENDSKPVALTRKRKSSNDEENGMLELKKRAGTKSVISNSSDMDDLNTKKPNGLFLSSGLDENSEDILEGTNLLREISMTRGENVPSQNTVAGASLSQEFSVAPSEISPIKGQSVLTGPALSRLFTDGQFDDADEE